MPSRALEIRGNILVKNDGQEINYFKKKYYIKSWYKMMFYDLIDYLIGLIVDIFSDTKFNVIRVFLNVANYSKPIKTISLSITIKIDLLVKVV